MQFWECQFLQRTDHQSTGEPMNFLTLADRTGMVETELFVQTCAAMVIRFKGRAGKEMFRFDGAGSRAQRERHHEIYFGAGIAH